MSKDNADGQENSNAQGVEESENQNSENQNAATSGTPLEQVKEQQAMARQNLEVAQQRAEPSPEVPGASNPSNRRKHPQRQMYGSGTDES